MCLVKNAFEIEVINNFKKYILILMVFNLNIVNLIIVITS
jgi:hypothetical protein